MMVKEEKRETETHGILLYARQADDACGEPEGLLALAADVNEDLLAGLEEGLLANERLTSEETRKKRARTENW